MADVDKYGIPKGGNPGPAWSVKWYANNKFQLPWNELVVYIALAGWPEKLWAEAAATSAAESSRQPFIYNTYKRGHFGLFQISRSAHADFFAPHGDGLKWVDGQLNASEGYRIYQAQGWGAWQAHTTGAYLAFLPQAKAAVAQVKRKGTTEAQLRAQFGKKGGDEMIKVIAFDPDSGRPGGVVDSITGSIGDAAGAVADATGLDAVGNFLSDAWEAVTKPSFWMRLGYGVLGVGLVGGGLMLILREQPAVQKAARGLTAVATKGAA
ncbi:hypothetical protein [Streptomyces sp. NPDC087787]|uniref:hypothetical protein n=1 Tax=Streptomyces sp. NPDC087787 TaxID=3365803 RepID=UPI0038059894